MRLRVSDVCFSYPSRTVIEDASFAADKGEVIAILGPNGTGKSTLLKCINHILKPAGGNVMIDGDCIAELTMKERAKKIGYVEQNRTITHTTVFSAVLIGRRPYIRWDVSNKDMEIAEQSLHRLGMEDFVLRYLDELSGGELQKVVIARALAQEPQLLLMDEPTSSLDLKNQLEVLQIIRDITRERNITAIVAMHDLNLALRYADKYIFLSNKTIFAAGGKEVITPENIKAVYGVSVSLAEFENRQVIIPL